MNKSLKIFVDTDAFVGLVRRDDANHDKAKQLFERLKDQQVIFFTSNYVFSESVTVISQRVNHAMAVAFIETMYLSQSPYVIKRIDESLEEEAIEIFKRQTSKNISYVDCTNMALMKQLQADTIFSFDGGYKKNKFTLLEDFL